MSETIPHASTDLAAARAAAEQRLLTGPQLEVRRIACPICWSQPLDACQRYPRGDHLARWLAAHEAGRITRAELAEVVALVVIVKASQVIPDTAVRAA